MTESTAHITCQELVEQATDYLEGELRVEELELLEQHVNFCEGCEWYLDEMRRVIETGGKLREEPSPDEALEPLLAAFRDWRRS
jgi:anti-sigma factor RsiW